MPGLLFETLNSGRCALVVIDVQYDFCGNGGAFSKLGANLSHVQRSAIDGRTTRHAGYEVSQRRVRKRVEEIFGWVKAAVGIRKTKYRGVRKVGWMFTLAAAAYNLVRMRNLGVAAC